MEWNGDPSWWQDGVVPLQSIEAPVSPVSAAVISVDGAAVSQPALDARSTPDSSKLNVKVAKVSKKYHSEPPAKRQPYFEFLPLQTSVKPTLRPKYPCSQKNVASIDRQAERDMQAAEAKAARYMQQAAALASHNHHHTLQLGPAGASPEEHVVLGDKGKHRPAWCRSGLLFDPISSTTRPSGRTESRAGVPSPYKSSLPVSMAGAAAANDTDTNNSGDVSDMRYSSSDGHETLFFAGNAYHTFNGELISLQRRPGSTSGTVGCYNPLTHTFADQPDAATFEKWQKETDRSYHTGGRRPSSCSPCKADTVGSLLRQQSVDGGGQDSRRPASAGGRTKQRAGDTWGTYDVLRNEWVVPPADERYASRETGPSGCRPDRLPSAGGLKPMRKAVTPPSTGIYDPIKGQWKVLPQQIRSAIGLDFAPRKLFDEAAFVKR